LRRGGGFSSAFSKIKFMVVIKMSKKIFVTGTGTDVGKTFITALMIKKLRDAGISAGYYKAAASGDEIENIPSDAFYVKKIAGLNCDMKNFVSYSYTESVSPHLAAKIFNRPIEFSVIKSDFAAAEKHFDFLTVEGSGGIICPLRFDDKILMLDDVIKNLNLSVVVVVDSKLGEINSAVLTIEHLIYKKIPVKGLILNRFDEKNLLHVDNKNVIENLTKLPVLATVKKNASDIGISIEKLTAIYD